MKQLGAWAILTVMLLPFISWTAVEAIDLGKRMSRVETLVEKNHELNKESLDRLDKAIDKLERILDERSR